MENIELARLVLKQAETDPGNFDMTRWVRDLRYVFPGICSTPACLAGTTLLMAGGYEVIGTNVFKRKEDSRLILNGNIGQEAQRLLGMSNEELRERFETGDLFRTFDGTVLEKFRILIEEAEHLAGGEGS